MKSKHLPLIVFAVGIVAFIGGCTPTTTLDTVRAPVINETLVADVSVLQEAQSLLESAALAENPDTTMLDAALLFASAGDLRKSAEVLAMIVSDQLKDQQYIEFSLFSAELDLRLAEPTKAISRLQQDRLQLISAGFNPRLSRRILSLTSEANFALGNHEQGLLDAIELVKQLRKQQDIRVVHNTIWQQLSQMPYSYLEQGQNHPNWLLSGWLQLAALDRDYQNNRQDQTQALNNWQQRWKNHPAAKIEPSALKIGLRKDAPPAQVALLLPLQEQYEVPSYTLLNGFMGAYYQFLANNQTSETPQIRIYDTSAQSMQAAYNNAIADGAKMIIGPLRQSEVEELMPLQSLPVPTLTLNRVDANSKSQPDNLFQFGLSARDEMKQIADRAWRHGQRNVLVIAPDNSWGIDAGDFFNRYWSDKGGKVVSQVSYPTSVNDFTELLKAPLQIDLSEQRGVKLRRFINSRIQHEARRRQDLDLVVVLGYPVKARQIKPALDFLYASDLPVVATSHLYNGTEQVGLDRDLSDVEFSTMPWTLPGQLTQELQPDERLHTAYRHLYAVGHDAFLIYRNLDAMQYQTAVPLFGATGLLTLSEGVVVRQQKWAKFDKGKVIEIQP